MFNGSNKNIRTFVFIKCFRIDLPSPTPVAAPLIKPGKSQTVYLEFKLLSILTSFYIHYLNYKFYYKNLDFDQQIFNIYKDYNDVLDKLPEILSVLLFFSTKK